MSQRKIIALRSYVLAVALLVFCGPELAAQNDGITNPNPQDRPKIGLVLSGGGARGAAHIGVLKVLEENNIPVDYIAGTSMGSIVGGLYATGISPDEITKSIQSVDWDDVFRDLPARDVRSFRRKRDNDLYLVKMRPGISKDGIKLPAGVVQGQKIDLALSRFTQHAAQIENFDDFGIPFRAVAADIVTGEAVVLGSGNLAHAIRASMSVPAAFSPMVIDGRKLVDGGIANNLPIDVVRSMGADVVIAVDISTPLLNDEEVDSVLSITIQLTGILTRRNAEYQIATLTDADVLLIPDLGDITSAEFDRAEEAIPTGRKSAEESIDKLRRYSIAPAQYAAYRASLDRPHTDAPVIDFIRLDNQSRVRDSMIAYRIYDSKVGEPFATDKVERDVARIYGLELFQNVGYDVVEDNGETGIEFYVKERGWGPTFLQLGIAFESNNKGDNIFNLAVSTLHTGLNDSRGELRLGLQLGEEKGVLADYHQPFGRKGMWFYNVEGSYGDNLASIFEDDRAIADFELTEAVVTASLGREFGTWGEARVGLRRGSGEADVRIGDPDSFPNVDFDRGEFFARLYVDELDSFYFPRSGYAARLEWLASREGLGADSKFEQIDLTTSYVRSWGPHTLVGALKYQSTISGLAPIQNQPRAGGFLNLSGFNTNELGGQHYARLGAIYYRQVHDGKFMPVYVGFSAEVGNVFQNRDDISLDDSIFGGSLFVGADTLVGPIYLAYGEAEGGNSAVYVFLGRAF